LFKCVNDALYLNYFDAIGDIIREKRLKRITEMISTICAGTLKASDGHRSYYYVEADTSASIILDNVSTGLKIFVIIKTLLQNDELKEGSTLILDEPEIHVHPEWQIVLAELVVLLQKDFSVTVLITTHSSYFLDAIEVFSEKHSISDKCKFYHSTIDGTTASIHDVTGNVEEIYKTMARPIQVLENVRYTNE